MRWSGLLAKMLVQCSDPLVKAVLFVNTKYLCMIKCGDLKVQSTSTTKVRYTPGFTSLGQ